MNEDRESRGMTQAAVTVAKPDDSGEYPRSVVLTHPFWEVIAAGGLNGRFGTTGSRQVDTWPVVAVFARGTLLTATVPARSMQP